MHFILVTSAVMSEAEDTIQNRQKLNEPVNGLDDLCSRLDQMSHLHLELTNLSKLFNGIYSFQMLMAFVDYFCDLLSNVKSIITFNYLYRTLNLNPITGLLHIHNFINSKCGLTGVTFSICFDIRNSIPYMANWSHLRWTNERSV